MLKNYTATGLTEIDGLCADFFTRRIPDLESTNDERKQGEFRPLDEWLLIGTCPRCDQRTLFVNDVKGVWHCEMCSTGGGVIAFQHFAYPEFYSGQEPDGWLLAARDVFAEVLANIDADLGNVDGVEH